jgi:anti-anti-sigma factor
MAGELQTALRAAPPLTIIDLRGEVTVFAEEPINAAYRQACALGATYILMNFAAVDYFNSAGNAIIIGVLAAARKAGQRLLITGLTPHYRKIFQMMGLSQHAPVFDTEDAAQQAVAAGLPPS